MRELTDAELDVVGGGTMQIFAPEPKPTGAIKVVEEIDSVLTTVRPFVSFAYNTMGLPYISVGLLASVVGSLR
jgi:hypothetical protein